MTDEFLHQRHAAYATPAHVISDVIKDATGQELRDREQIIRGYENEVYRVRTHRGEEFIVRVRQHGAVGFGEEAWAMERCRNAGAPVPEVYLVTSVTVADQLREVMVLQQASGRALSEVAPVLTQLDFERIYTQVGAALDAIHSVHVDGMGQMHIDGTWDYPDWDSFVQATLRDREADAPFLVQAGLRAVEVDDLLQLLSTMRSLDFGQPVLCHGDLATEHLFIDDQLHLTGVIDFGQFGGGTPALDFAVLLMYHPEINLAWLQRGYQTGELLNETFALHMLVQQANVEMSSLGYGIREEHTNDLSEALQAVRSTLNAWHRLQASAV